jgi:hypothetical protein
MLKLNVPGSTETKITIMRRTLPSTRFRRLGALAALAALVAAACFGLSAHADNSLPTQAQSTASVTGR